MVGAMSQYGECAVGPLNCSTCPPIFQQFSGQNNGRPTSSAFLLARQMQNEHAYNATMRGEKLGSDSSVPSVYFPFCYSVAIFWFNMDEHLIQKLPFFLVCVTVLLV